MGGGVHLTPLDVRGLMEWGDHTPSRITTFFFLFAVRVVIRHDLNKKNFNG